MESDKEEQMVFLDRTTRATRGKRMTKLLDDEVEEDEQFWNQEALKEEEHDDEYEAEAEAADEFDSDFNDDEPEPEAAAENEKEERDVPKKRLVYPGKTAPKKNKKKKLVSKLEDTPPEDEKPGEELGDKEEEDEKEPNEDMESEKVIRKSTRTSVIVRQAERDALRAAIQATTKPIIRKKVGEEKRMTQEEMLLEAAQTEIMNLRNLERVLAREEEVKKKAIVHKEVYKGPQVRYLSKDGCNYIEFCNGATFSSEISTKTVPYPEKAVCVITGLPAKYRDPKTGHAYATLDAFKAIRERFMDDHNGLRKKMEMGDLFDTLASNGFSAKRKRTMVPKTSSRSVSLRNSARFCNLETPEASEDSDSDSD